MKNVMILAVLPSLLLSGPAAGDLSTVPRTLQKEPKYQSPPRYCLLVFGLEGKTRVWLVLDGNVLYVDLNGNGDLTEPAERFKLPAFAATQGNSLYAATRELTIGSIQDGALRHEKLHFGQYRIQPGFVPQYWHQELLKEVLAKDPEASEFRIGVNIEWQPRPGDRVPVYGRVQQWAGTDVEGWLQFADCARDAPIVHFAGPQRMGLEADYSRTKTAKDSKEAEVAATIGTPGAGKGTFAQLNFNDLIYETDQPLAEVAFPARMAGGKAILHRTSLKYRGGNQFSAPLVIPKEAGAGTAEVRLSLPDADVAVSPTRVRIPIGKERESPK